MTVYLVGAGPGDPGLITVRAQALLCAADVVVHDRLVDPRLLELAPSGAEIIDVGKRPGGRVDQSQVNNLLIDRGREHRIVVRLKGGDPFVFGRGGEEAAALAGAGIRFEVVPGVSSAVAVPAYAGVPVTQRGLAASFTVIAGRVARPGDDAGVDWEAAARLGGTLVLLMAVSDRGAIAELLIAGGRPPGSPAVVVERGTFASQRVTRTTLAELGGVEVTAPATIVVGAVAGLGLDWFAPGPLAARRVVVTRTREQASALAQLLSEAGALPIVLPTIEIAPPADGGVALARAVDRLSSYGWVVFTSTNAVRALFGLLRDGRDLAGVRVAAVGSGTAAELAARGIVADLVPTDFVAESLLEAMIDAPAAEEGGRAVPAGDRPHPAPAGGRPHPAPAGDRPHPAPAGDRPQPAPAGDRPQPAPAGDRPQPAPPADGSGPDRAPARRVLLPQAAGGRDVLSAGLAGAGYEVDVVEAYRTVPARADPQLLAEVGSADVVTFASSSAVRSFVALAGLERVPPVVACIGPITAATAVEQGLKVDVVAMEHSVPGLVAALADHFAGAAVPPAAGAPGAAVP